jgi:hypothetical protein
VVGDLVGWCVLWCFGQWGGCTVVGDLVGWCVLWLSFSGLCTLWWSFLVVWVPCNWSGAYSWWVCLDLLCTTFPFSGREYRKIEKAAKQAQHRPHTAPKHTKDTPRLNAPSHHSIGLPQPPWWRQIRVEFAGSRVAGSGFCLPGTPTSNRSPAFHAHRREV